MPYPSLYSVESTASHFCPSFHAC